MHAAVRTLLLPLLALGCAGRTPQCLAAPDAATQNGARPGVDALDAYIRQAMRDWDVPGLAVAVVKDDSAWLLRGYGVRRTDSAGRVQPSTMFALMSPTKTFTTSALAMLAAEGRLSWDDPVVRHLPTFRLSDSARTRSLRVRDLVSHRSGYADAPRLWYRTGRPRSEVARGAAELEAVAPPGTEFHYNNVLFVVAGEVVESATGASWDRIVRERIFEPLGMRSSATSTRALVGRPDVAAPHARRWFRRVGPVRPIDYVDTDPVGPAGSIVTSAEDLVPWMRLHLNGGVLDGRRVVDEAALLELWRPHVRAPREEVDRLCGAARSASYGLGWFVLDYRGRTALIHGGGIDGQRSAVGLLPDARLGVAVLSNMHGTEVAQAVMYRTFDLFLTARPHDWSREFRAQLAR